jgi:hypothetical protein
VPSQDELEFVPVFWSPQPVLGFRRWAVLRNHVCGAWKAWTEAEYVAGCVDEFKREHHDDGVPHTDGSCGDPPCGLYVFRRAADLIRAFPVHQHIVTPVVYGLVELSGKVVEHERGYRAARARVVTALLLEVGRMVRIEDPGAIDGLFADPWGTVERIAATDPSAVEPFTGLGPPVGRVGRLLEDARARHQARIG